MARHVTRYTSFTELNQHCQFQLEAVLPNALKMFLLLGFYLIASSSRGTFELVSFTAYNISPDVIRDAESYFSFQFLH